MKPVEFPEVNVTYAKDQPEYMPLPVYRKPSPEGDCVSCWKLSFIERVRVLFTGKVWLSLWTFNKPLTPSRISTVKRDMIAK